MKSISVLGFGGHASTVREACELSGRKIAGFYVEEEVKSSFLIQMAIKKQKSLTKAKTESKGFRS